MSTIQSAPAVVVGVDGSRAAIHAALWAVDEAVSRDIPLRLVYVIDPLRASGDGSHDGRQIIARAALYEAYRAVDASGKPVKIETDVLWGRPLTKLLQESRSAAMICVGSIGLNHACRGEGTVAAALAGSALCPVAVIHRPPGTSASPQISAVVAGVDNGVVLRHAFEEARMREVPLRVISAHHTDAHHSGHDSDDESRSAQTQLDRRLARWTRLYPDVRVEPAVIHESVACYLERHANSGQAFVTDAHAARDLCGAYTAGCSMLTVRCGNL
ncbi:universal stress protein [Mycobacterium sp. 852002-51163_SCH5372311]|uniref:universal stress protein n=1 Tax=Mycobacterium sp. 852002-51163_SCH5372311 TaxID=1834097 RepID=UPI000801B4F4|nr:universal stress protein [Mycobacterium sp. 852002-51163_SCH5372311]OBF81351.1 universal stress protein [Mycobacterium sp. 852002-51163_SCH5372311]